MAKRLIKARDLHKHYTINDGLLQSSKNLKALSGVGFDLYEGQTLAVVGESGCGKSTLARLLTTIEEPTSGQLSIDGIDMGSTQNKSITKQLRQTVQMVFQDPFGSLNPRQKVGDILQEPLLINTSLRSTERKQKALEMMSLVGLRDEHFHRYPHMFSGGQRQRIAIARALILKPKVVVLDEPVSALDVSIQAQVINLLVELQKELGLAYVFISHDLSIVRHIADEVLVMYLGKPVEQGPSEVIFNDPKHPYTQALLSATPSTNIKNKRQRIKLTGELPSPIDPPNGCAFNPRCQHANKSCKISEPVMDTFGKSRAACLALDEGRI
ncbi:MAG: dipeptide ABC transporter ATP-binding protein [Gammaproteobacteria bacterium]|nr:dipeptide ABC transporter ATP-binding protein [Gammaproteobacteria bacterium]MBT4587382.1 dipeptide ABC transporter ATP-binding protein [Gammaproteobacteria bacterium]MBT4975056.1 dipeptide ABC transporter ATP-binding protein [Gammaproteobacteria bacterium]MBT5978251.1 dipeptide ABC transporter ATP-binding protein [Gammaproteobacteria bacterium]MBT6634625.1 dipeptide ABC transporter ATP-binding protein [Gammaproteobacteria bacterium]